MVIFTIILMFMIIFTIILLFSPTAIYSPSSPTAIHSPSSPTAIHSPSSPTHPPLLLTLLLTNRLPFSPLSLPVRLLKSETLEKIPFVFQMIKIFYWDMPFIASQGHKQSISSLNRISWKHSLLSPLVDYKVQKNFLIFSIRSLTKKILKHYN
jgi:hypothetical protein